VGMPTAPGTLKAVSTESGASAPAGIPGAACGVPGPVTSSDPDRWRVAHSAEFMIRFVHIVG